MKASLEDDSESGDLDDLIVHFRLDHDPHYSHLQDNTDILTNDTPIATIKGSYCHYGFTLFLIVVDQGIEKWSILRRYSWFREVYLHILKTQILADTIDFPPQRILDSLSEAVVAERMVGLQAFLDFICKNSMAFQIVCAFLLPIRKMVMIEEEQGSIFLSKMRNIPFMDPYDPIDAKFPAFKTRGTLDAFPSLNSFFPHLNSILEEKEELQSLRVAIAPLNRKLQKMTDVEKLLYSGLLFRLRSLYSPTGDEKDESFGSDVDSS